MAACHCAGRSGTKKRIFRTVEQAKQIGMRDFGDVYFDIYPCPTKKNRFHLSHVQRLHRDRIPT